MRSAKAMLTKVLAQGSGVRETTPKIGGKSVTKLRLATGAIFCMLLVSSICFGQDGIITGKIADISGAVLPGVSVTVTGEQVMGQRTVVSDEAGNYRVTLLPPGVYSVKYELPGFKTLLREGIQMSAGFAATINVNLEVSSVSETVTVEGQSPVIDIQNATVATNFNTAMTAVLPTAHDVFTVLGVTPGVQLTAPDVGGSAVSTRASFRVFGSTSQWNVIDGVVLTSLIYEDPDAYTEMQFGTASKGAESPLAGAYNNIVVKSGSNKIHGLAFADWEPLSLQSSNLSAALISQGATNSNSVARAVNYHFDAGGPIQKDKLWWWTGYRHVIQDLNLVGFKNAQTGAAQVYNTDLQNLNVKLNYQINRSHSLAYVGSLNRKYQPYVVTPSQAAFVNTDSAPVQDNPDWQNGINLNSVWTKRITTEVRWGEFGWKFPRLSHSTAISTMDLDTQEQRGGFNAPFFDRSHHMNLKGAVAINTSGTPVGNHNIRAGWEMIYEGAPYTQPGPTDNIRLQYRGGFKTLVQVQTYDTPFTFENRSIQHGVFFNDNWNIKRLTLNLGVRLDAYKPYYPDQGKTGIGPYQSQLVVPRFDFHWLDRWVPRLSLIYDVFGTGRTAIKASFNEYGYNAGSLTNANATLAGVVNPMALTTKTYSWDPTVTFVAPYVPDPTRLLSTVGGVNRTLDPHLTLPYTTEYVGGIDQQVTHDMTVRFNFVRKFERNRLQQLNTAIPFSAYNIPVAFVDPGRPGLAAQTITLYNLNPSYRGLRADVLTNDPANSATHTTYNVEAVKRMSRKWQMITGVDISHYKTWLFSSPYGTDIETDTTGRAQNPNLLTYNSGLNYWHWQYKLIGGYDLPYGISSSGTLRMTKGEPYGRTLNTPSFNQGVQTLQIEPIGTFFYDSVKLLDLRFARSFNLGERLGKVEGLVDIFNVTNSAAVLSRNTQTGPTFGNVLQTVNPRIARLGIRWTF